MVEFRTQKVTGTQIFSTEWLPFYCVSFILKLHLGLQQLTSLQNQIQMAIDLGSLIVIINASGWIMFTYLRLMQQWVLSLILPIIMNME